MDENDGSIPYAAGIFDGEGCVSPYVANTHKGKYTTVRLRINVTNTSIELLEKLKTVFGVGSIRPKKRTTRQKSCWQWTVTSKQAKTVLEKILPYLIVKKDQAIAGIRISSLSNGRGRKRSPLVFQEQLSLVEVIKDLKRRPPCQIA
jgi:hypothetical protein